MVDGVKILLIGGTSHVGKTTNAKRLADELGWRHLSTDQLARHPGRPWRHDQTRLPDDVVAHYSNSSVAELVDAVMQHYRDNVWPIVAAIVQSRLNNPYEPCLVFEGSAMLPELVAASDFERSKALWLTAPHDQIAGRIHAESRHEHHREGEQRLIDAFVARTLAFNDLTMESAKRLGQQLLDTSDPDTFAALVRWARQ